MGLVVGNILKPGAGMNIDPASLDTKSISAYASSAEAQNAGGAVEFFMNIIPNTIVGAFATGNVLQTILFAVLFGIELYDVLDQRQGIEHVVMPEQGIVLPGMVIVAGGSHTTTYGTLGALGFGIGTSEMSMYSQRRRWSTAS